MKLIKRFSPKRLFRSGKSRSGISRSDPPSFGSGASSSSSSSAQEALCYAAAYGTPTSVLQETSLDWSESPAGASFELLQAFKLIDRDGDGIVSGKELEAILRRLGTDPPEVALMVREVDADGDGFIRLEELMARVSAACGPACDSELRETFEFFDADHDGRIAAEELYGAFSSLGDEQCTLDDCRRMIAEVDEDGDGFVCFAEFVRMMVPQR